AVTHGSQAVESGCVLAGHVAVGNAAGNPFLEFHAESPSRLTRGVPELAIPWGGFHRWHIHRALDNDPGSLDGRLEPVDGRLDPLAVGHRGNPDIDDGLAEGGHHIGPDAAIDLSHVHGDPALGIVESLK